MARPRVSASEDGPPAIELIQSVPSTPLAGNGGVSFHHLGFWTDRLVRSSRDLDANGWPCAATVASIDTDPRRFTLHQSPYDFYVELFDTAPPTRRPAAKPRAAYGRGPGQCRAPTTSRRCSATKLRAVRAAAADEPDP